jgi:altronate hydrolase
LYHHALGISWPKFLLSIVAVYIAVNVVFAVLFLLCGAQALVGADAQHMGGAIWRAFFFSVETFATIGYGEISPVGLPAHFVMVLEALIALMSQALITGLLFARFARPTAAILFSKTMLVAPFQGGRGLMFRITNLRDNQLIDVRAQVMCTAIDPATGIRKFTRLALERSEVNFFPLAWTLVHPINESSPLWKYGPDDLRAKSFECLAIISATDETFAQVVHARSSYTYDEIVWGARFQNIFNQPDAKGNLSVDVERIDDFDRCERPVMRALRIHPGDNVVVALADLAAGATIEGDFGALRLRGRAGAKHKIALANLAPGDPVTMYGVLVARATMPIARGESLSVDNVRHDASPATLNTGIARAWTPPDAGRWAHATFNGFHRADGRVGTRNVWLVVPLVFCENRNVRAMQEAFTRELGYGTPEIHRLTVRELARRVRAGTPLGAPMPPVESSDDARQLFPNVDGVRFLTHEGGCGGTRQDTRTLCSLIAGYLVHPNVAGATVLSLGCQHAQVSILREEIAARDAAFSKPLLVFEQQTMGTERNLLGTAIRDTFAGLVDANTCVRAPAPLSALSVGLKCGGSDGFSGISANPAVGHASDLIVALGGTTVLAEFPELLGVEQDLIERCVRRDLAERFTTLMGEYNAQAHEVGSGFEMNPSPGNIRDGLLTDAMKSAGAARKGGTAPVSDVLDYPQRATTPGLTLLCTPGNDVECTTGQAASGNNLILFTTGLGTPTGNPVAPVLKLSSNSALAKQMPDTVDIDCGAVIAGETTIEAMGEEILGHMIETASGRLTAAEKLGQWDFIPWKRGVSL